MWIFDAFLYIVRGLDDRAALAPPILLTLAWSRWLRSPRNIASLRGRSLLAALVLGTAAAITDVGFILWRVFHPWLDSHAYCPSSAWADLVVFFGTAGSLLLCLVGRGPGRALAFLAVTLLSVFRFAMC